MSSLGRREIEEKLKAAFGNQLAIGSLQKNPRLIDLNMIKCFHRNAYRISYGSDTDPKNQLVSNVIRCPFCGQSWRNE